LEWHGSLLYPCKRSGWFTASVPKVAMTSLSSLLTARDIERQF
jgi:hypothetical protein